MFFLSFFVFMSFCLSSCSHQGEEELFISIIWAAWWLWANKIKKVAQIVCRTQNNRYLCSVKKCWWKPSSLHQHSKRIICGLYLCRASHYFFKHLYAVVSYAVLHTLYPYLYILKAQLSMFILLFFVILSFCLNTLKTLLNFFSLSLYVFMSFCL